MLKDVIQQLLEAEMNEQLGIEKYQRANENDNKNYLNGYSRKNVASSFGKLELDVPRDRKSEFEPIVVKNETNCNELDKK